MLDIYQHIVLVESALHQNYQLPIKELNELLTTFDQYQQNNADIPILDIIAHTEANYVSELLLYIELKSPKLTREFVKKLHSGEACWQTINGNDKYIDEDFDFELLEELGIIFFEHDWLRVSAMLPSSNHYEHIHETVKPILRFTESLKKIIYSRDDFQPLRAGIRKGVYESIVPQIYNFEQIDVDIKDKSDIELINISTTNRDINNLISDYYWKKVISSSRVSEHLKNHHELKQIFPELISIPSSTIFNHDERRIFSTFCMDRIKQSSLLTVPFKQFQNILYSHRHLDINLIATKSILRLDFSPEPNKNQNNRDTTTYTSLSMSEVNQNYKSRTKIELNSNLELLNWGDHVDHLMFFDDDILSSLLYLIKYDLFFDYQIVQSRDDIESLLKSSQENNTLRHYLINVVPHFLDNIIYDLFLLSKPNEFEVGALQLINKVKIKYNSTNYHFDDVKNNISNLLSDTLIKVAINNNKERNLSLFLISLAKNYITNDRSNESFEKDLLEKIIVGFNANQLQAFTSSLIEEIEKIEVTGVWPNYTFYLLFLLANACDKKNSDKLNDLLKIVRQKILSEYKKYFNFSLQHNSHCLNSDHFYDSLNWELCNDREIIDSFIDLKPSQRKLMQGFCLEENSNAIYYMQSIRSLTQVLINLFSLSNANKIEIQRKLKELITSVGFESEDVNFPLFISYFSDDKYDLWDKVTIVLNSFDEYCFDEIVSNIAKYASLSAMMSLYSNASKQERKNKIMMKIESRDNWSLDKNSLPMIEKSFLLALEQNKLDIANVSLKAAKDFLDNHSHRNNNHFKEYIEKWLVFDYKYNLLSIYYSANDTETKVKALNDLPKPKLKDNKIHQQNRTNWYKEADLFRRYIFGLIKLNDEPENSKIVFEQLYKEYKSAMFSHLIFTSKLQTLIKSKSDSENYKKLIREYEASHDIFDINELSLNNKSDYIHALYLSSNYNEVDAVCSRLIRTEQLYRPITITYNKALRKKGNSTLALKLLENYQEYHSVKMDDKELEEELKEIKLEIDNEVTPIQRKVIRSQVLFSNKDNDELRSIYNEIINKPIADLAKIVSNDSNIRIEDFLYNQVFACLKEILKRGRNLEKLINKKDENAINDWFISLFNQKMSNFSISASDQARIGSAESNKGVGETDGLISDRFNSSISMFEAMNLNYINKIVINKHVNKITNYDRESLSPIFIVSYCYFHDFINKRNDYCEHIKGMQYSGFDKVDTLNHQLKLLDYSSDYYNVVELRYRGGKEISIYHILIDLTLPPSNQ